MNRTDIMVDLETLGLGDDAAIIQISAVKFCIRTGNILAEFDEKINLEGQESNIEARTLSWWLHTNPELLSRLIKGADHDLSSTLVRFIYWIEAVSEPTDEKYLWGNGCMFDNVKIKRAMERTGNVYPIGFRNDRDMRTVVDMAALKSNISVDLLKDDFMCDIYGEFEQHNALEDAKYQARVVSHCFNILTESNRDEKV